MTEKNISQLLYDALFYENGHARRTSHINNVLGFCITFSEPYYLSQNDMEVLCAAAILHDIAIGYCKKMYNNASLKLQMIHVREIAESLLRKNGFSDISIKRIIFLIMHHHDYTINGHLLLDILIDADIFAGCLDSGSFTETLMKEKHKIKTIKATSLANSVTCHT